MQVALMCCQKQVHVFLLGKYILPNGQFAISVGTDRSCQTAEKDILCMHQQDWSSSPFARWCDVLPVWTMRRRSIFLFGACAYRTCFEELKIQDFYCVKTFYPMDNLLNRSAQTGPPNTRKRRPVFPPAGRSQYCAFARWRMVFTSCLDNMMS